MSRRRFGFIQELARGFCDDAGGGVALLASLGLIPALALFAVALDDRRANEIAGIAAPILPAALSTPATADTRARPAPIATIGAANIELAMMLDVTSSMRGEKIAELKTAAKLAADILLRPDQRGNRTRIALAPFSASVNAGDYADRVSNYTSRDGCVFERSGKHAYDDFPPLLGTFLNTMRDPDEPDNDNYACPPAAILPMSDNVTLIKDTINGFEAEGKDAGHLGIAWAWYLLSPDWSGVWPAESQPAAYGAPDSIKVVILTADGGFDTSYANGAPNRTSAEQARRICDNMKDQDVIVYAVAFQASDRARDILKGCASTAEHFIDAGNGGQLKSAFREIATGLKRLRVAH